MLIVALLASVFLSVSAFSVIQVRNAYLLKLVGWQIVTRIRQAKIEAIQSGKDIRLLFDVAQNRLLYRGKSGKTEIVGFPREVTLYTTNFPSNTLFFYSPGTPSAGGTVTIRSGAKRRYIIVTPVTGRVRCSEKPPQ